MTITRRDLPKSARELVDVIGLDATLTLIGALPVCGSRPWRRFLYVPIRITPDHWLVRVIGIEAAERLVYAYRGIIIEPPRCSHIFVEARNRAVVGRYAEGATVARICAEYGLSYDQARYILRTAGVWRRQSEIKPEDARGSNDNGGATRRPAT